MSTDMYKTTCAYCGKPGFVFAKDKQGTLPTYYCSKVCQGNAGHEKRFVEDDKQLT